MDGMSYLTHLLVCGAILATLIISSPSNYLGGVARRVGIWGLSIWIALVLMSARV